MEIKFTIQQIIVVKEKVVYWNGMFVQNATNMSKSSCMDILFYDSVILLCNKRGTVQKDEWILIIQADFLFFFLFQVLHPL